MKTIILYCLITLFGFQLDGQSTLKGIVSDENGNRLFGANIYLEGTYDGTTTNEAGEFHLKTDEVGSQVLVVEYIGYVSFKEKVELERTTIAIPAIALKEEFNELSAVTITAGTFEAGDKNKSISFSSMDMVTTAGAAGDVFGALQALPGTTTVGESGRLFVKGGDSRESKTFIDGTLVYVPYSSSSPNNAVRGRFSPFMFSGTMFSTGGYSAEYGQALSSVLSLQTNALPVQDQLNISLLSVGAELEGTKTWENASVTASINYENLMPYMRLAPQYTQWEKEPATLTGNLGFRLKTGKSGMLKFYSSVSQSQLSTRELNLDNPGSTNLFRLTNNNAYINGSWIGEIKKDWILTTGISYTSNKDRVTMDSAWHQEQLEGIHAKASIKHRLGDRAKVVAGAEWFSKNYGIEYSTWEQPETGEYLNNTLAGFIESELYASTKFVTRIGARFEYSDYLEKSNIAPRISAAYKMSETGQLSLSYGWFFQDPEERFMLFSNDFEYERADHYTLNYILKGDQRTLRTELYFKDYKDLVKYTLDAAGGFDQINNRGDGSAYGLDLFWRDQKSIKYAEYWISYSYIEALRDYYNYPHKSVPGFSSKHNLTLVYKHWVGKLRSQLGGTYRFSSPRYYSNPNSNEFNSEKTIPFQSLDVNWSYLHRQNVIFYFSVSNLLGFKQEFGQVFAQQPDSQGVYQSTPKLPGSRRFFILGCFITLSKSGDINQLNKIN